MAGRFTNRITKRDGYVTGIEPGTNFPFNRHVEREAGRLPKLAGGESCEFVIEFDLLSNAAAVKKTAAVIQEIQGKHATQVDRSAPKID